MSESESEERALRDVLCDAVGYLSKLGTNLRLRAERIQSRNMKNTHSVRKTTDKVLLICDLSKKSIEKVEDVVRKGMIKDAQNKDQVSADIRRGGPSSEAGARNSGRVEKSTLRKVGKLHLRIPNEVQLEHFLSCRVKAHRLPRSSLQKYPLYLHAKRKPSTEKCDRIAKYDNVDKDKVYKQNSQIIKAASLNDEQTEIKIKSNHKEKEKTQSEKSKIRFSSEDETETNVCTPNKSNKSVSESELNVLGLHDSKVEKIRHYKIPKRKTDTSNNVSYSRDHSEDTSKGLSTDKMKTESSSKSDTNKSTSSCSRDQSMEKKDSQKKRRHILSISSSDESDREEPPQTTRKSGDKIETAEQSPVLKATSHNIALYKNKPDISAIKEKINIPVEKQKAHTPDDKEKADIPTDQEREDIPSDIETADIPANKDRGDKEREDIPADIETADIPANKERGDILTDKEREYIPADIETADIPANKEKADIPVDENEKTDNSLLEKQSEKICQTLEKQSEEIGQTSPKPPANSNINSKDKVEEQSIDESDDMSQANNVDSAATEPIDTLSNTTDNNDNLFHSLRKSRSSGSDKADKKESRCSDDKIKIKRDKCSGSSTSDLKKSTISPKPQDVSGDIDISGSEGRTPENHDNEKNTKQCTSIRSQEESGNSSAPNDDVHHILSSSSDDDIESNKNKQFPANKESEAINKSQADPKIKTGELLPRRTEESSLSHSKSKLKEVSEVETDKHLLKISNVETSNSKCDEDTQESEIFHNNESTNSSTEQAGTEDDHSVKAKPFIKCIDLNKLLKSPVKEQNSLLLETHSVFCATEESKHLKKVQKKTMLQLKGIKEKIKEKFDKIKIESSKQSRRPELKKIKTHEINDSNSERSHSSYISVQKRAKELANFKPKQFSINVTKLPSFTSTFLEKHSLTRITQAGSIVAQLASDSSHVQSSASAKTDLLDESSDSSHTADHQTKSQSVEGSEKNLMLERTRVKRLHTLERMRVKRLLLTESSNSDTDESKPEDNKKKENNSAKVIDSLQDGKEKNGDAIKKKTIDNNKRKLLASSSSSTSDEDALSHALEVLDKDLLNDENTNGDTPSNEKETEQKKSSDSDTDGGDLDKRAGSKASSISQVDGNDDDLTDDQMGRTTRSRTGSVQNSDTIKSDDKVVDGLSNMKSLHRKNKSRESPSSTSDKTSKKSKGDPSKSKDLNDDILLNAESKSSSDPESDIVEEVPVSSEPNGEAPGELARADLLEEDSESEATRHTPSKESDDASSKSNGRARPGPKKKGRKGKPSKVVELDSTDKDDSDPDEELKVRRRKADVISSGSEAGGSNRKTAEHDSDYGEGSAASDDSAQLFKRTKRKAKKSSDSDSVKSSTDGNKKKRRRIKQVKDSDASDSDSDNDGKKGGRKNIRKVMGKDQLEEATKKAAREERERMARITERQKVYNSTAFDESGKPDEIKLDKVVLDFDPETKKPLIELDTGIVKKLKPHQANGIKFMWDACFESVKQIKKGRGSGCILAHCMGLGKTLQVVALTHTLLSHEELTGVRRVLVVCPLSTVLNWVNEFRMWIEHADHNRDLEIYELSRYKQNHERSYQLREWMETGGVCVLGYEMFRNLSADNPKKFRKKMLANFQESLVNPGPDLVVCDEGHLLKNEKTSLSQSMNRVRTLRRIVLTGTPLQNNLKEYYCMVQFVKPNLLGKYNEYLNRFVNPITNGQYTNSTEQDIRVMKRRSHVLHKMLDGAVQRRDYGVLAPFLPPKHEYVLFITLTDVQIKLYQHYLDNYSRRQAGRSSGFLFPDFQSLQRIWTHPLVLKANSERYELAQQKKRDREEEDSEGSLVDFLNDESTAEETSTEEESDISDASDDSRKKVKKKSSKKSKGKSEAASAAASRRSTRANPSENAENIDMKDLKDPDEPRSENPTEWWIRLVEEQELEDVRNSNKLMLLFDILRQCEAIGDKLLVFSQSLYSLDLIEHFLSKIDDATQMGKVDENLGGHVGSWSPGIDYFRLDGQTSCENRSIWCKNFNREDNPRARLFLISTRAGGLGINLVAANRVVIFDVSWNPSHDVQSIFRVYRFGQKKPCYVYRFLAMGTMEEKIYERQVTKQAISKRVIDEQQIDRHYNETDLAELYTFQPQPEQPRPVPLLPKDRLFAEMLKDHEKLIYRYHEHDSLLENKEEETLTEEERKAAWEDFENEKNRPPPVPFANTGYMPQMNGMNNMMQQQLMLATMLSVLRKDYPGLSEQQVANILPQLIYGDPTMYGGYDFSMMQKMRALSGMNPNMMGGMGGATSSLAFQPTWQQQQQMQLQRVQQQQALNSGGGGVKYYAGGLGSRDPLSMALQQKQQREMMLSNTGDRLRDMLVGSAAAHGGMRAAAALPPPAHTGEVVNLDDSE